MKHKISDSFTKLLLVNIIRVAMSTCAILLKNVKFATKSELLAAVDTIDKLVFLLIKSPGSTGSVATETKGKERNA